MAFASCPTSPLLKIAPKIQVPKQALKKFLELPRSMCITSPFFTPASAKVAANLRKKNNAAANKIKHKMFCSHFCPRTKLSLAVRTSPVLAQLNHFQSPHLATRPSTTSFRVR